MGDTVQQKEPAKPQSQNQPQAQRSYTLPESLAVLRELQKTGRFEEARQFGQALMRAAPNVADAFSLCAATEMAAGRPDLALPLAERAAQLDGGNADRFGALGKVLRGLGRDAEAAAIFEKALSLFASRPPAADPGEINRRHPSHHLQHRPVNHVHFRKSRHFESLLATWLQNSGREIEDLARFYFLAGNVARTLARGIDGALAELGVHRGLTAKVLRGMAPGRILYLFDTFTGFPEGEIPANDPRKDFYRDTSLDAVKNFIGTDETVYCAGIFPATASQVPGDTRFAFVHIDCDLRAPILAGLEFFYPRLNPGGLLVVHDYGNDVWPEVAQTVDEFLADKKEGLVLIPDKAGSAVLIKQ